MSSSEPRFPTSTGLFDFNQSSTGANSASLTSLSDTRFRQMFAASDSATLSSVKSPPAVNRTGLLGQDYDSLFASPKLTRTDAAINSDWGSGSPDPAVPSNGFLVRWTGKIQPTCSEAYTFYTLSEDGVRVWMNGQHIVNNWTDCPEVEDSNTTNLIADQKYNLKLEYYDSTGGAVSQLSWSSPSQKKEIIPQSQLYESNLTLPTADLITANFTKSGAASSSFGVIYKDATAVKLTTIDSQEVVVSGTTNFRQLAKLVSVSSDRDSRLLTATYSINVHSGAWDLNCNRHNSSCYP